MNNMSDKKRIIFLFLLIMVLSLLTGCGRTLSKTTTYYSLVVSPSDSYIRLESDGDFVDSLGLKGKYEIKGDKISFDEEVGANYNGYIEDKYLYYYAYDANDAKIPEEGNFDAEITDGQRTSFVFSADGSVTEHIYQEALYDITLKGSYERKGKLITCTYDSSTEDKIVRTYYVRDGVLYDLYTSDESHFSAEEIEKMEKLDQSADDGEASVLAVVIIVAILMIVFALIIFVAYKAKQGREEK